MTETKVIIESLATLAKRGLPNCKGCGGQGMIVGIDHDINYDQEGNVCYDAYPSPEPCPDCARLREMASFCWHIGDGTTYDKATDGTVIEKCAICAGWINANEHNPTLTIPEVRSYMEVVGVWEKFVIGICDNFYDGLQVVDIFTSPAFFAEAARFLKGEAEGK